MPNHPAGCIARSSALILRRATDCAFKRGPVSCSILVLFRVPLELLLFSCPDIQTVAVAVAAEQASFRVNDEHIAYVAKLPAYKAAKVGSGLH